jgi:translation elongation factor EF-4
MRKGVLTKCYGGAPTRKRKLLAADAQVRQGRNPAFRLIAALKMGDG